MSSRAFKKLTTEKLELEEGVDDELISMSKVKKRNKKKNKPIKIDPEFIEILENHPEEEAGEVRNAFDMLDLNDENVKEEEKEEENEEQEKEVKEENEKEVEEEFEKPLMEINPFLLLETSDKENEHEEDEKVDSTEKINKIKPKIKKNKKKKKPIKKINPESKEEIADKEFDKILEEVRQKFYQHDLNTIKQNQNNKLEISEDILTLRKLLAIDTKCLDSLIETTSLFGSRIVNEEIRKKKFTRFGGRCLLATPRDFWPLPESLGLKMGAPEKVEDVTYYSFQHSEKYREAQKAFYYSISTFDANIIMNLSRRFPYHVDTLLQLSEIAKTSGNMSEAAELIERALFACERAFHPSFSLTSGMCRLNYNQLENRPFFLALYRHLQFLSRQGCWRTALEFTKLILSLSPNEDNLCTLLHFDLFALKAKQYKYLLEFNQEWIQQQELDYLPNYHFSSALAKFHLNQKNQENSKNEDFLDMNPVEDLAIAFIKFPNVILGLLKKAAIPVTQGLNLLENHWNEIDMKYPKSESQLRALSDIYVERASSLWKESDVLGLINSALEIANEKLTNDDFNIKLSQQIWQADLQVEIPMNLCRHILISDYPQVKQYIPKSIVNRNFYAHDPLPPLESVSLYDDFKVLQGYTQLGNNTVNFNSIANLLQSIRQGFINTFGSGNGDGELIEYLRENLANAPDGLNSPGMVDNLIEWLRGTTNDDEQQLDNDISSEGE